ncbi:unnamed protein product [Rhizophagus irregularis]|uniref:Uncharacterized protein n=1 Tax=Rhizophagus irregularis TaxID=588596 RepID=A0A915ZDD5_9GLOM|nr:unnamed protein product [Rhizophagus irregularis]
MPNIVPQCDRLMIEIRTDFRNFVYLGEKLPDIKMSTSITSQTNVQYTSSISSSKSRLPISILPEDPEEKQKHIIGLVLEQFPYLSLSDSDERDDRFNLNSSVICPICNRDHKETICKNIKGEWSSGEYCRERTYRLKCWNDLRGWNPNSECEISIEAKFRVMHMKFTAPNFTQNRTTARQAQVQNTSVKTNQNPSLEGNNSMDSTNKNQTQVDDLSYYSPDDDFSDSEESKALTVKHRILSLKRMYEEIHEFPDPKYIFDLKTKGLTTPKKFVAWWNKKHPDFQITVDSIWEWNYRKDEDSFRYNLKWGEYGD